MGGDTRGLSNTVASTASAFLVALLGGNYFQSLRAPCFTRTNHDYEHTLGFLVSVAANFRTPHHEHTQELFSVAIWSFEHHDFEHTQQLFSVATILRTTTMSMLTGLSKTMTTVQYTE